MTLHHHQPHLNLHHLRQHYIQQTYLKYQQRHALTNGMYPLTLMNQIHVPMMIIS